jgi:hypothetical protein
VHAEVLRQVQHPHRLEPHVVSLQVGHERFPGGERSRSGDERVRFIAADLFTLEARPPSADNSLTEPPTGS